MNSLYTKTRKKIIGVILITLIISTYTLPTFAWVGIGDYNGTDAPALATESNTSAQESTQTGMKAKDVALDILKQIGMGIARQLLNKLTESTVNWINSGFEENPQFVDNPKSFFTDIGDTQVKSLINVIGYDEEHFPFGRSVATSLIREYTSDKSDFGGKAVFTLDTTLGSNWRNFSTDFSNGGWEGYNALTENPANTPIGAYLLAKQEVRKKINKASDNVDKELQAGKGFLNQKVCTKPEPKPQVGKQEQKELNSYLETGQGPSGPQTQAEADYIASHPTQTNGPYVNPTVSVNTNGTNNTNANAVNTGTYNPSGFASSITNESPGCQEYKTMSPGSIVESQINGALTSKFRSRELASVVGDLASSAGAIVNALTNQLINKGIGALSSIGKNPESKPKDDWEYNGYTIDGPKKDSSTGQVDYSADRIIDFQELLVDGKVLDTQVSYTDNGDPIIKVIKRGKTVIDLTKADRDYYKKSIDLVDGTQGTQSLGKLIMTLDQCLPGPDINWKDRLHKKFEKARIFLSRKVASKNEKTSQKGEQGLRKIEKAEDEILRNIQIATITNNIPSYSILQSNVAKISKFSSKIKVLYEGYLEKTTSVAQLESIKKRYLDMVTCKPNVTTNQNDCTPKAGKENDLRDLMKEYVSIETDVTQTDTPQSKQEYDRLKIGYDSIVDGISLCNKEKQQNPLRFNVSDDGDGKITGMTITPSGSYSAYSTGVSYINGGKKPFGLEPEEIDDDLTASDVQEKLQNEYSIIDGTTGNEIGDIKDDTIAAMIYAKVKKDVTPHTSQTDFDLSVDDPAVRIIMHMIRDSSALDLLDLIPVAESEERLFYCKTPTDATDTSNYYRSRDLKLKCTDFYESDIVDYTIDKNY